MSEWTNSYFGEKGKLYKSISGHTKSVSVNEPLDEGSFTLALPLRTRIIEKRADATKYFEQESEGHRREISAEE